MIKTAGLILPDNAVIDISQDVIDEYDILVPDPDWTYTDNQGHHHYRSKNGRYTTLEEVIEDVYWDDDEFDIGIVRKIVCRECGEEIEPGRKSESRQVRGFKRGSIRFVTKDRSLADMYERYLIDNTSLWFVNAPGEWVVVCIGRGLMKNTRGEADITLTMVGE